MAGSRCKESLSKETSSSMYGKGTIDVTCSWKIHNVLAEQNCIEKNIASNVIQLVEDGATLPFIVRYRGGKTNNMSADKLRTVIKSYDELKCVQQKAVTVMSNIEKCGQLTPDLKEAIAQSTTMLELNHLNTPFKQGSKGTLAERARTSGLGPAAEAALRSSWSWRADDYVMAGQAGRETVSKCLLGCQHIIADVVSKDKDILVVIRELMQNKGALLKSTKVAAKKKEEAEKFELYHKFSQRVHLVKPHQTLAINRGEEKKVLRVTVELPDQAHHYFVRCASSKYIRHSQSAAARQLIQTSIEDSFKRLVQPLVCRHIRSELTKQAHAASIDVFMSNLRSLLLQPPLRGEAVLGVDPGYRHGCKMARVDSDGRVAATDVVYMHGQGAETREVVAQKVKSLLAGRCRTIALGNGTACRDTERVLCQLISEGVFSPLDVRYAVVQESGVSVYSVTERAARDLPGMDVNLRSAVAIARRLQDPLAEYIKVEPRHIGVGMYQHDVDEKALRRSLDGVVEECVSFVGVELNYGGEDLLSRVAGLNSSRAKKIISWRAAHGPFVNREQLLEVSGIGPQTFAQCAGFVRINAHCGGLTEGGSSGEKQRNVAGSKRKASSQDDTGKVKRRKGAKLSTDHTANPLDRTCVHPESYELARRVLQWAGCDVGQVGSDAVRRALTGVDIDKLSVKLTDAHLDMTQLPQVVSGLLQPLDYDLRCEMQEPVFRSDLRRLEDVKCGDTLRGRVVNIVHFGAFVDVGVGVDVLVHSSGLSEGLVRGVSQGRKGRLELGDTVTVRVAAVDLQRRRVGVALAALG